MPFAVTAIGHMLVLLLVYFAVDKRSAHLYWVMCFADPGPNIYYLLMY